MSSKPTPSRGRAQASTTETGAPSAADPKPVSESSSTTTSSSKVAAAAAGDPIVIDPAVTYPHAYWGKAAGTFLGSTPNGNEAGTGRQFTKDFQVADGASSMNFSFSTFTGTRFDKTYIGVNFKGVKFIDVDMTGACFTDCNFKGATWNSRSKLDGSTFQSCGMFDVLLSSLNMTGTRFIECELSGASFYRAALVDCDLRKSFFIGANLEKISIKDGNLSNTRFRSACLREAHLSPKVGIGADFSLADLYRAELDNANWKSAIFTGARAQTASFIGANLEGADFKGTKLFMAQFSQGPQARNSGAPAILSNVNFKDADLRQANLSGCCLVGVDLRGARLWDANLAGADARSCSYDESTEMVNTQVAGLRDDFSLNQGFRSPETMSAMPRQTLLEYFMPGVQVSVPSAAGSGGMLASRMPPPIPIASPE